jgi:hypothetical protein
MLVKHLKGVANDSPSAGPSPEEERAMEAAVEAMTDEQLGIKSD